MTAEELLDRDRYATALGARLVEKSDSVLVVEMTVSPHHRDGSGRVATGALFSIADCAMSLICNLGRTSVAVATHVVRTGDIADGEVLTATAVPRLDDGRRTVTWDVTVTSAATMVASFTGTTLALGDK